MTAASAIAVTVAVLLGAVLPASAQTPQADRDAAVGQAWSRHLADVIAERGVDLDAARAAGDTATLESVYRAAIERTFADPRVVAALEPNRQEIEQLTRETVTEETAARIAALREAGVDAVMPTSLNAASTNPLVARLTEQSGFSDLIGFAIDGVNSLASDSSGVSVNLSGLLLAAIRDTEIYSAPEAYRRHDLLRRFGGTVSFGAELPEAEITGFSGFPGLDRLFDVFVWDFKARVYGDRDPRAEKWWNELVGRQGNLVQVVGLIVALAGPDAQLVARLLREERLEASARQVKQRIAASWQVTLKTAGQHLTQEDGRDKYWFGVLVDKGIGPVQMTGNVLYSLATNVDPLAVASYDFRDWHLALAVTVPVAPDVIAAGRSIELTGEGRVIVPHDASSVPVDRSTRWNLGATIAVPWGASAKIPVSIVYTNDPDELERQRYVRGQLGFSYDFGSLGSLFGGDE